MKRPPNLALLAVCALLCVAGAACGGSTEPSRPNILLISADTLRYDHVGANGYRRNTTPNLDALAADGVNFGRAYTHAPSTAPAHATVLTSLYPSIHGVSDHGKPLDEAIVTLPELFRNAGYSTAAFTQLNGPTYQQGFDTYEFLESPYSSGKGLADLSPVVSWIRQNLEEPFFLFLHSYDVHLPYNPPQEYIDRWAADYSGVLPPKLWRPDVDRVSAGELEMTPRDYRYITDLYDAELVRYDEFMGQLFGVLRQLSIWDETVVVLFSDHGEEFGEHGQGGRHSHSLYEELLRTPLIVRGPGVPKGQNSDLLVRNIDIAPTLLDLAGLPIPETFQGKPLEAVWSGRERRPRMLVAERWNERALISAGFKLYSDGRLYDLAEDPLERVDVAERYPDVSERLREELDHWLGEALALARDFQQSDEIQLTREERRRLRALGYIE